MQRNTRIRHRQRFDEVDPFSEVDRLSQFELTSFIANPVGGQQTYDRNTRIRVLLQGLNPWVWAHGDVDILLEKDMIAMALKEVPGTDGSNAVPARIRDVDDTHARFGDVRWSADGVHAHLGDSWRSRSDKPRIIPVGGRSRRYPN